MSSDEEENRKLYEFDQSYLKKLNQIRKQFNLMTIESEEQESAATVVLKSSTQIDENEDLYYCKSSYLEELNKIRKELNMAEIGADGTTKMTETHEMSTIFEARSERDARSIRRKKEIKSTKSVKKEKKEDGLEVLYSPPRKKLCVRGDESTDSEGSASEFVFMDSIPEEDAKKKEHTKSVSSPDKPSEESSPIRGLSFKTPKRATLNAQIFYFQEPFRSLNVPDSESGLAYQKFPSVESSDVYFTPEKCEKQAMKSPIKTESNELTVGLDLPKRSREFLDFPSLVHIYDWANLLSQDIQFDNIFLEESETKRAKKKANAVTVVEKEKLARYRNRMPEVETTTKTSKMRCFRTRAAKVRQKPSELATIEDYESDDEDEKMSCSCPCLSLCFRKKSARYFS